MPSDRGRSSPRGADLDRACARSIRDAFDVYDFEFQEITRRSRGRFERRDWHGTQRDARERLEVYRGVVDHVVSDVRQMLKGATQDKSMWVRIKDHYTVLTAGRVDLELTQTFFNSVTRRIFATVGVDPDIEYVNCDFEAPGRGESRGPLYRSYPARVGEASRCLIEAILRDHRFDCGYRDLEGDARRCGQHLDEALSAQDWRASVEAVDMLDSVFYRNKGAYLVGRIRTRDGRILPLLLALLNPDERGVSVDALLTEEDETSVVFSFTRSYFHVTVDKPSETVAFLRSIMPRKPVAELYTSMGYNKHGKTVLYRDLLRHLEQSDDRFEVARGEKGMVMTVFTLPSYDVVFKVIKDTFSFPKKSTRREVMERYTFVFMHDRAGRLVDAQEFEHLEFPRERFSPSLLDELLRVAGQSVRVHDDSVVVRHVYVERRLVPLNLYLQESEGGHVEDVVVDHGQAIKDLVAANIFPGDILLKNFGVTRHGRVVFYDYDELCLVTDCCFREIPESGEEEDDLDAEPWYYVAEDDIFPQEFGRYLGLSGHLREIWMRAHAELLDLAYWRAVQEKLRAGALPDIFPYRAGRRLQGDVAATRNE